MKCDLCPRNCNIDRKTSVGFCKATDKVVVAKSMLHYFEEPVISGVNGSGAVFFSGCNLKCVYCQNREISRCEVGKPYDSEGLYSLFVSLVDMGAHNINLVTPTPHLNGIIDALEKFKANYDLPIIYNCGGYESVSALKKLDGLIDVYLPDFKYRSNILSQNYSKACDYHERAVESIGEMIRQRPQVQIEDGLIKKGVIIRHLVLPGSYKDSIELVREIKEKFPTALLSLMSQYTPSFYLGEDKNLKRKITAFEYNKVLDEVIKLGIDGFCQDRSSSTEIYTPTFLEK